MSDVFDSIAGSLPLLVSVPHDGRDIPDDISGRMTAAGRDIPDTDWHVAELYSFARDIGAPMVVAKYSRYVVDLNRPASDVALYEGQLATGVCPSETFGGEHLYADGSVVSNDERADRVSRYWQPYHDHIASTLQALKDRFGYALLWDAHSIPSRVPRLFDGELPELNLGSFDGRSCADALSGAVASTVTTASFVHNGRFKGGYITRHYGQPENNVHALQLEISQRAYMDEATREVDDTKANNLRATLRPMVDAFIAAAEQMYR